MPTFPQIVDDVARRTTRYDRFADIVSYVRLTIRELETMARFKKSMIEDQLTAVVADGTSYYTWTHPSNFMMMKKDGVYYPASAQYPKQIGPGILQRDESYYWYTGLDYIIFEGLSDADYVNIAYYIYLSRTAYYRDLDDTRDFVQDYALRPAYYDLINQKWQYASAGVWADSLATPALELAARELVSNWMTFNWHELIAEGAIAKILIGTDKGKAAYSFFSQMKDSLRNTEPAEQGQ